MNERSESDQEPTYFLLDHSRRRFRIWFSRIPSLPFLRSRRPPLSIPREARGKVQKGEAEEEEEEEEEEEVARQSTSLSTSTHNVARGRQLPRQRLEVNSPIRGQSEVDC